MIESFPGRVETSWVTGHQFTGPREIGVQGQGRAAEHELSIVSPGVLKHLGSQVTSLLVLGGLGSRGKEGCRNCLCFDSVSGMTRAVWDQQRFLCGTGRDLRATVLNLINLILKRNETAYIHFLVGSTRFHFV